MSNKLRVNTSAFKTLTKLMSNAKTARLTAGQAKYLLDKGLVAQVTGDLYRVTPEGEAEYESILEKLEKSGQQSRALPTPTLRRTYDGADLKVVPSRPGAQDFLRLPSRRGNSLVYRDEKLPLLSMGSMTDFLY